MTLTALLLAGGQSRRMGIDKATILIDGKPLWRRQLGILNQLMPERVCVSALATPSWCPPEMMVVGDRLPPLGPLSGVTGALGWIRTSHLLVLAVDMPRMTSDHLQKLWNLASDGAGVIPSNGECYEPLCAVYPREAFTCAEECLARRDGSLQRFARDLLNRSQAMIHHLTAEDLPLYHNMNTPSDLPVL